MKIFLCGDVMIGRGVDQILPFPSNPKIYEPFVKDARDYVKFAEEISGKIDYPVSFDYIWGDFLKELKKFDPEIRIINLETTITKSENFYLKGINYRMNPENIDVLNVLKNKILICSLANNHILDFNEEGLLETIDTLKKNNIYYVGAGENIDEAKKPVILEIKNSEILIFSYGHISSGIPYDWKAEKNKPGVNLITDFSEKTLKNIKNNISQYLDKSHQNIIIFSIHWGSNWGYEVSKEERDFAHFLIDECKVDIVYGHSSHHFKGFEIYKGKIIFYGCGDFINDYEGIGGYEWFKPDLALAYFLEIDEKIEKLIIVPFKIKKFRLNYPEKEDIDFVFKTLKRESIYKGETIKENNYFSLKIIE